MDKCFTVFAAFSYIVNGKCRWIKELFANIQIEGVSSLVTSSEPLNM